MTVAGGQLFEGKGKVRLAVRLQYAEKAVQRIRKLGRNLSIPQLGAGLKGQEGAGAWDLVGGL